MASGKWYALAPLLILKGAYLPQTRFNFRQNNIYLYARKTDPIECFRSPLPWLRPYGTVRTFWTTSWHSAIREVLREMSFLESHTIMSRESIPRYLWAQKLEEASVNPRTTFTPLSRVHAMRAGLNEGSPWRPILNGAAVKHQQLTSFTASYNEMRLQAARRAFVCAPTRSDVLESVDRHNDTTLKR